MLMNQLADLSKEQSDEMLDKLGDYNLAGEALHTLLPLIARIPWHCGNPECINEGCNAIRAARDAVLVVLEDIKM